MTTQTPATAEIEKWLRIRSGFSQFLTPAPDPKENYRILPELTPALWIHGHLWPRLAKMGLETSLEVETNSRDSITGICISWSWQSASYYYF